MSRDKRSVEDLLSAIDTAPTFGMNARELILQATRRIAAKEGLETKPSRHSQNEAAAQKQLFVSLYKKGPELLLCIPKAQRPLVPYKAIQRSKVPRITRQAVLDRLLGQHLVLALHSSGRSVCPAEVQKLGEGLPRALGTAVEQEERIYQQGKASKAVYLNYAARVNADTPMAAAPQALQDSGRQTSATDITLASPTEPLLAVGEGLKEDRDLQEGNGEPAVGSSLSAREKLEGEVATAAEQPQSQQKARKRPKVETPPALVETDVDWRPPPEQDDTTRPPEGEGVKGPFASASPSRGVFEHAGARESLKDPLSHSEGQSRTVRGVMPQGTALKVDSLLGGEDADLARSEGLAKQSSSSEAHGNEELPSSSWRSPAALEEYSPSRHGGESPPKGSPEQQDDPRQAGEPPSSRINAPGPPGNPKVAAAVAAFLRTHLDPLYQAKVISRAVFKAAMQKTVEKVMRSHLECSDARFLIKEGPRIHKLLMLYVERLTDGQ